MAWPLAAMIIPAIISAIGATAGAVGSAQQAKMARGGLPSARSTTSFDEDTLTNAISGADEEEERLRSMYGGGPPGDEDELLRYLEEVMNNKRNQIPNQGLQA